jgi:hypothetical protein
MIIRINRKNLHYEFKPIQMINKWHPQFILNLLLKKQSNF